MRSIPNRLSLAISTLFLVPQALAFGFSYTAPTECGDLTIKWEGGTGPYQIYLIPAFNVPRNLSVPDSAFSNGKGSYTMQLPLDATSTFLITMSDSTGFGTGGISDLLTVGNTVGSNTCNHTEPSTDFTFVTNNALQQCRSYSFSDYNGAQLPITIRGFIPLGNNFVLNPSTTASDYSWKANVKSGTRMLFWMTDAAGRNGGSTDQLTVGATDDNSCINSDSPASTAQATVLPTATGTGVPTATSSSGSTSKGGIIGGVIGAAVVAIILIASLVWFFLRRRRQNQDTPHISTQFGKRRSGNVELLADDGDHSPQYPLNRGAHDANSNYEPVPYMLPDHNGRSRPATESGHGLSQGPSSVYSTSVGDYPPGHPGYGWNNGRPVSAGGTTEYGGPAQTIPGTSTGRSSKHALAFANSGGQAPNTPARFVLHTDAGEVPDIPPDEEDVVELPPQYNSLNPTARRTSQRQSPGGPAGRSGAGSSS